MKKNNEKTKSVFFGTPEISVHFLEKLKNLGFMFNLIITNPDRPVGRKKILTAPPVKIWALKNNIEVLQPEKIDENFMNELKERGSAALGIWDFFFVLAYGKILPVELLELPKLGTLNLHPSLLPKYRGPSPIMSAILDDQKNTGISIMKLDEKMDHGPILIQEKITVKEWEKNNIMEKKFAEIGAGKFFEILKNFLDEKITEVEQNHSQVTFCKKYQKSDMELDFPFTEKNSRKNFLKYSAFPKPFYFDENKKRNIITAAHWCPKHKNFVIEKIIPEGKKEKDF